MKIFYHWWPQPQDGNKPHTVLRCPIIQAIATLRAQDKNTDICVLCPSQKQLDWDVFPKLLNFEVKYITPQLASYKKIAGWELLSRIFDIDAETTDETVLYCDTDVFWLKPPFPLECNPNKFCFDGFNSGLFYFQKGDITNKFMEVFKAYTISALNSPQIRKVLKTHVGYNHWADVWDEMILTYMFKEHSELFNQIPLKEHICARRLNQVEIANLKAFHCNGSMVCNKHTNHLPYKQHSRGLMCVIVKEWWESLNNTLPFNLIQKLYTPKELDNYLPMQFSIINNPNVIINSESEGDYWITPRVYESDLTIMI